MADAINKASPTLTAESAERIESDSSSTDRADVTATSLRCNKSTIRSSLAFGMNAARSSATSRCAAAFGAGTEVCDGGGGAGPFSFFTIYGRQTNRIWSGSNEYRLIRAHCARAGDLTTVALRSSRSLSFGSCEFSRCIDLRSATTCC